MRFRSEIIGNRYFSLNIYFVSLRFNNSTEFNLERFMCSYSFKLSKTIEETLISIKETNKILTL